MKKWIYFIGIQLCLVNLNYSQQTVDGHISGANNEKLIGATVYLVNQDLTAVTDKDGFFSLSLASFKPGSLIISYVGYVSDTTYLMEPGHYDISLKEGAALSEIKVTARGVGTGIDKGIAKIETINQLELTKDACCDLAGCFNTQGSVQVNTTNVLTNTKELRLLGFSGVYNQLMIDGMPMLMGNAFTYGLGHLSGTFVDQIMVAKGTTSVLQGSEALTGQINIMLKKYANSEAVLFNSYLNTMGEMQLNANISFEEGPFKFTQGIHFVTPNHRQDIDGDGFMDMAQINRFSMYQTLETGDVRETGYSTLSTFLFTRENRTGGMMGYQPELHAGTRQSYGQTIELSQPSLLTKHYYRWNTRQGIGAYGFIQLHNQESWFGLMQYDARMWHGWVNLQFESMWGEDNLFKAGLSYRHMHSEERIQWSKESDHRNYGGLYHLEDYIPGAFAENTLNLWDDRISMITGVRVDRFNGDEWIPTPRVLIKYLINPEWTLRLSGGRGVRAVRIFSEYPTIIASNRNVVFEQTPRAEQSWNTGISLNFGKQWGDWVLNLGGDLYWTHFENQVFPDFDSDPTQVIISNKANFSQGLSNQLDLKVEYDSWLEYKFIYNYLDVYALENEVKRTLPFIQKHRITQTLSVRPLNFPVFFDLNAHWNGPMKVPSESNVPEQFRTVSPPISYWTMNMQATYTKGNFSLYGGVENVFNVIQRFPIRGYQDPFGQYFDVSTVWGPTQGAVGYIGFRYKLMKSHKEDDHTDHTGHNH